MNTFHKTEVQTVILRGLTGLDSDRFNSYDLRCNLKLRASSVNSQKIATDKWKIYDHIWPFFSNYMFIFHKIEIQTVILRCLTSLNLNWYKSYDTKRKNSKNANLCFWTKLQKNGNGNISFLCHNLWINQNFLEFRPVKYVIMIIWTSVLWKMNIHIAKKWPEIVVTWSFIKGHSFPISLYLVQLLWHKTKKCKKRKRVF